MDRSEHSSRGARPLACTASATAALTHLRRVQLVSMLITEIQDLGGLGYLVFAGLMIFLQAQHSRSVTSPSSALCPPTPCHPPPPPPRHRVPCEYSVAQVVPIAAAFILTVSAGAIFGGVKGTAMVLTCSTISASISFAFSRSVGRDLVLEAAQESPQ